jgi:hypothetical protein
MFVAHHHRREWPSRGYSRSSCHALVDTTKDENAPNKLGSPESQTCLGNPELGWRSCE